MKVDRKEIFGPVLCIAAYDTLEEAIEIVNDTEYGLCSSVCACGVDESCPFIRYLKAGLFNIQVIELDLMHSKVAVNKTLMSKNGVVKDFLVG